MEKKSTKLIANNKKAYHDYFIEETLEAGISLHGTEVKSLRMGKCSIKESYIQIERGEMLIYGMHISPYEKGNIFNKDPLRVKKLLVHKAEIRKLAQTVSEKGVTIVPLQVYFKDSKAKVVYNKMSVGTFIFALLTGVLPAVLFLPYQYVAAALFSLLTIALLIVFLKRKLQGYTGDCCGAAFLLCELNFYLGINILYHYYVV